MNQLKRVEPYLNMLHKCIRCGYCYELCHIYKITRWESDTPRGKLILLYGILNNELKLNEEIGEKIFECYGCKRCDNSCSAKVPITEIFQKAKADIIDAGFQTYGTTSRTNEDICCRCQICVSVCKYDARSYDKENDKIVVDPIECKSCGACEAACPTGAAYSKRGFYLSQDELREQVLAFLGG